MFGKIMSYNISFSVASTNFKVMFLLLIDSSLFYQLSA